MSKIKKWSQVTGSSVLGLSIDQPFPYIWKMAYVTTFEGDRSIEHSDLLVRAQDFIPFKNDIDYAYMAIFNDYVVISFRGTGDSVEAWVSDFDPYPLREDEYRGKFLKDGPWGKGCIHDGFYTGWSYFKKPIENALRGAGIDPERTPIYVTGHSRGGALAELCARHLAKNLGMPIKGLITFASPAPGTKEYRDQFRMLPINGTWVRNRWDIVTFLPPPSFGFKHGCSNLVWLNQKPKIAKLLFGHRIRDHYYTSYDREVMRKVA